MMNERCPICYNMSLVVRTDENERSHGTCTDCGFDTDADGSREMAQFDREHAADEAESGVELERETPLGEEIDGGNDWVADAMAAQYDDDPNPYHGTYSEE